MATLHWHGSVNKNFNTPGNWTGNGNAVPGSADTALIDLAGSYTVTSAVANTVDALGIISTATLDITAGTFTVLNGTAGTGLAGTIKVEDAAALSLGGTVTNSGTIQVLGTSAAGAALSVNTTTVVLQGGGAIQFSNDVSNTFGGPGLNFALDNVDNRISGAGVIGNNTMGLTNETAGVIDADLASPLTVTTGADEVINFGTMEATAGGNLVIASNVDNQGGTIEAIGAGSTVTLQAQVFGGVVQAVSGGVIVTTLTNLSLDGLGSHPVTNSANLAIADNHTISLAGSITNNGTIGLHSTLDNTDFVINAAIMVLTGSGRVQLSNNSANRIYATARQYIFDNVSNTIAGAGQLGVGQLTFINGGLVDADQTTALSVNTTGEFLTNTGTMEATGVGGLVITNTAVLNAGGTIKAVGSGVTVSLNGANIEGGTLATATGGVISVAGAQLDGVGNDDGPLTNTGTLLVSNLNTMYVEGSFTNSGVISLVQTSTSGGNTALVFNGAVTTLQGGGQIVLNDNSGNYIDSQNTAELDNVNNTISGSGRLGTGGRSLIFVNEAKGVVDATGSTNALVINTNGETLVNRGLLEATGASNTAPGLVIQQTVVNNAGGLIESVGLGGLVDFSNSSVQGGTLALVGPGLIQTTDNASLDGLTNGVINNTGLFATQNAATLTLYGLINNTGTIQLNADATNANTDLSIGAPVVTLEGAGSVQLSDFSVNRIYGSTLDNVNNVIEGSGQFGVGSQSLTFINQAAGTVDATGTANALVVNTAGIAVTNVGLLEDTGTAGLVVTQTAVANTGTAVVGGNTVVTSGTVLAAGSGSHVNLTGGGGLQGGLIATTGGGVIETTGVGYLDGLATDNGVLTSTAAVLVNDSTTLNLYGSIVNEATITLDAVSTNANTDLVINSANVTLSGGGKVLLSDAPTNRIYGSNNTLTNVNNVIAGSGQFGVGSRSLRFINEAAGTVDATGTNNALVVNTANVTLTNIGLLEDTGAAGLVITQTAVTNNGTAVVGGNTVVTSGTVLAAGATSHVNLTGGAGIQGGVIATTGGGVIETTGIGYLDGLATDNGVLTSTASVLVNDNTSLDLYGSIVNKGTINLDAVANNTDLLFEAPTAPVTLSGGGKVLMSDVGSNRMYGTLVNVDNTISGAGQIGIGSLSASITNEAKGVIDANFAASRTAAGTLTINTNNYQFFNAGLLESTASGGLVITQTNIVNTGTVQAAGAGANVDLTGSSNIEGGTLKTSGGGVIAVTGVAGLDGYDAGAVANTGLVQVDDQEQLYLDGTINNTGTIQLAQVSASGNTNLTLGTQTVTLTGHGQLIMAAMSGASVSGNRIYGAAATDTLINVNNTISGVGQLGTGQMTFTNSGVVNANQAAGQIVINLGGYILTNQAGGELLGTGAAGLSLQNLVLFNNGLIEATDGSSVVMQPSVYNFNLEEGELSGGTWEAAAAGHGATLDITGGPVTTDSATIILSGGGSFLNWYNANTGSYDAIETSLTAVSAGANLEILGNRGYSTALSLTDAGTILLSGGTLATDGITISTGGLLTGVGTVKSNIVNAGTIQAKGGLLSIVGSIGGTTGLLNIVAGATLQLNAAVDSAGTVTDAGTLLLGGSFLTAGSITIAAASTLSGNGTVNGPIANSGSVIASGGQLKVTGSLTGTGVATVQTGATLALGNAADTAKTVTDDGTLLLGGGTLTATSLVFGAGSVLGGFGTLDDLVTNAGTVQASGGTLTINGAITGVSLLGSVAGGTLSLPNSPATATTVSDQGAIVLGGSTLTATSLTIGTGALLAGSGTVVGPIANSGTVEAKGGLLTIKGSITGTGALSVLTGATLSLGTLPASVASVSDAGTLLLAGGTLTETTGTVTGFGLLSGFGKLVGPLANSGSVQAKGGLLTTTGAITGTGSLSVLASASLSLGTAADSAASVTDGGSLLLTGGTLTAGSLTVAAASLLSGFGKVADAVANSGALQAKGGLLDITGAVTGTGALNIQNASSLELGAATAETVTFATGATGLLKLDAPATFTGPITGLVVGDIIDFSKTTATSPVLSGTTLSVDVGGTTEKYKVSGVGGAALSGVHFVAQSDGAGGTELVLTSGAAAVLKAITAAQSSLLPSLGASTETTSAPVLGGSYAGLESVRTDLLAFQFHH